MSTSHISSTKEPLLDGSSITRFSIVNTGGTSLTLMDLGASILACTIPSGINIIRGDTQSSHFLNTNSPYFGRTVGRLAGRTHSSPFTWEGIAYQLAANENAHTHLHGGKEGLSMSIWDSRTIHTDTLIGVEFSLTSPHKSSNYPGALEISTLIALYHETPTIHIAYRVSSDIAAPINLTNHSYFNLGDDTIRDHSLQIVSDKIWCYDAHAQVNGDTQLVDHTPFDFRTPQPLGKAIDALKTTERGGVDHIWSLQPYKDAPSPQSLTHVSTLTSSQGITMETHTTSSVLICYTGNTLAQYTGGDRVYDNYEAVCMETQHAPGFLHSSRVPVSKASPSQDWTSYTEYKIKDNS